METERKGSQVSTRIEDLKPGSLVRLLAWPEEGIEAEVAVVESVASAAEEVERGNPGEGREALVRVPPELRESHDHDGMREVWFDQDTLDRTELLADVPLS